MSILQILFVVILIMIKKEEKNTFDFVIIGGGITSAITAYYLKDLTNNILIIDNNYANTKANVDSNTINYQQVDIDLFDLNNEIGTESAINMYEKSLESIKDLNKICNKINLNTHKCSYLYYTTEEREKDKIIEEYNEKKKAGFKTELIDNTDLINIKKGLLLKDNTIHINTDYFIEKMFSYLSNNKISISKHQNIKNITYKDGINYIIYQDEVIQAKNIIFADEVEMIKFYKNDFNLNYSFYIVTEPLNENISFCTAKDTKNNYIKFTPDNKIILKRMRFNLYS